MDAALGLWMNPEPLLAMLALSRTILVTLPCLSTDADDLLYLCCRPVDLKST